MNCDSPPLPPSVLRGGGWRIVCWGGWRVSRPVTPFVAFELLATHLNSFALPSSLAHIAHSKGLWCLCRYVDLKSLSSVVPGDFTTSLNFCRDIPMSVRLATWPGPGLGLGLVQGHVTCFDRILKMSFILPEDNTAM